MRSISTILLLILLSSISGYAYAGDMVFARSPQGTYSFESVANGNGRIEGASNTVRRYVTDHLGNVRAIVTGNSVVERNDYYPFGGRHPRNTLPVLSANRWRLGAKESQPSLTGSLVDFGARMYDPHTGRWTTQDPMAWKYLGLSPYNYCGNNPVNLVDPDGSRIIIGHLWGRTKALFGGNSYEAKVKLQLGELKRMNAKLNESITCLVKSKRVYRILPPEEYIRDPKHPEEKNIYNLYDRKQRTIYYDPENNETKSHMHRPAIVGLSHELGHAEDDEKGIIINYNYDIDKVMRGDPIEIDKIEKIEANSLKNENIVREYLSIERREKYVK